MCVMRVYYVKLCQIVKVSDDAAEQCVKLFLRTWLQYLHDGQSPKEHVVFRRWAKSKKQFNTM
jgi:hypothetical protein